MMMVVVGQMAGWDEDGSLFLGGTWTVSTGASDRHTSCPRGTSPESIQQRSAPLQSETRLSSPLPVLSCPTHGPCCGGGAGPGLGGGGGWGFHVYQLFWVKRAERDFFFPRLLDSEELWLVSVSRPHPPAAGAGRLRSRVRPTVTEEVRTSARLIGEARLFLLLLLFLSPVAGMSGPGTKSRTPRQRPSLGVNHLCARPSNCRVIIIIIIISQSCEVVSV